MEIEIIVTDTNKENVIFHSTSLSVDSAIQELGKFERILQKIEDIKLDSI